MRKLFLIMSKECAICKKSSMMVWKLKKLRGKYNPTVKKRKYPNLQWVHIPLEAKEKSYKNFAGKRIKACAKCIKAISKRKK